MTTKQTKRHIRVSIIGKYLGWMTIRAAILVIAFLILEVTYRVGVFGFLIANIDTQTFIYNTLFQVIASFGAWFFLAFAKKIIVPATILTVSPALGKIVRDPTSAKKTNKSIAQYLTYLIYIVTIGMLVFIWTYSFIGTWVANLLGNGLVIMLTFILGLFSSSVLGNILGYAILGGTNEFKVGDRVQIGDSYGDIIEIGFFFTRIKTIKDEVISIPNLTVMNKEIRNFSTLQEVMLYVQVTLGYDIDKDYAQATLIEAAKKTKGVLSLPDKASFVLLRELGSYAITYELNVFINEPNRFTTIKSDLISNMLIELKKAGIDIATPAFVTLKGEEKTLPHSITQFMDNRKAN
ncbi:MAG: mechanosensitive ion channel family protein [Nitrososphaerota archaeon]|jgi:small-conductance mechanosensitive channel|nr:mechanosensitive ion channel family protein [Nitrososphaerota archaeon]